MIQINRIQYFLFSDYPQRFKKQNNLFQYFVLFCYEFSCQIIRWYSHFILKERYAIQKKTDDLLNMSKNNLGMNKAEFLVAKPKKAT